MLKRFCVALIFVAAGGMIAARAQTNSSTAAGQSQNAPQAVPCPPPDCPPQTRRSVSQDSGPRSDAGTLLRGFTLSAPPPPWHAHSMQILSAATCIYLRNSMAFVEPSI